MEMNVLTCPGCGATLDVDDGIDTFYCKYCGHKIIISDMSDVALNARVQVKRMKHKEQMQRDRMQHQARMRDKQYEQERYKIYVSEKRNAMEILTGIALFVFCLLFLVFMIFLTQWWGDSSRKESDQEEVYLQSIVNEVMIDIENGDFDEATIKANTIHYTSNWSGETKKKWNETRKTLLKQIKEAEKEAKKESGGGLFDWF